MISYRIFTQLHRKHITVKVNGIILMNNEIQFLGNLKILIRLPIKTSFNDREIVYDENIGGAKVMCKPNSLCKNGHLMTLNFWKESH